MKRTKIIVLAAALAFGAAVLSGCGGKKDAGAIRVVLDWTPNTNHTGLYAALEKGYFAEEGIGRVEIMQPPEDGALLLLAAGNAEFGVEFQESMAPALAREDPLPVIAVAAIVSHNTSGIMSLARAGITRPRDLENKRYASWETPLVTAVIRNIVENDGGDFSKVTMIPSFATDAFSALETDVDAIWIYYGWDGVAAELRGKAVNYLDLGRVNPRFDFYTPVLAANSNYAEKNPQTVKQFLRAVSRGYEFAAGNPREAAEILLKHAPELDRGLVTASQQYLSGRYRDGELPWGRFDGDRWDAFYGWMFEEGLLERDIRGKGFTNDYLPRE
ncbi:MAG: ABC transporter substrate-binding protein [Treponema sp.]|jgi:ABC-type nitrate/sulfonate/bicarbonate transport system substrate-binding protein|nr:ABC transporter substrate-binding protein [Treponema sp.]